MGGTALLILSRNPKAILPIGPYAGCSPQSGTAGAMTSWRVRLSCSKTRAGIGPAGRFFKKSSRFVGTAMLHGLLRSIFIHKGGGGLGNCLPFGWLLVDVWGPGSLMGAPGLRTVPQVPPGPPFIVLLLGSWP